MPPELSVVIPAYRSTATLGGCLTALRGQDHPSFEVVVVDSSPDDASTRMVQEGFPEVRFEHSTRRLLPHEARNRAVDLAGGQLLVFTDPDIYPHPGWLTALVTAHARHGGLVSGALTCHGGRWLDVGIHLCKFSKWLPGGSVRPVDMGPTAALLCPRRVYDELGGFRGDHFLGDALFSWEARRRGHTVWLVPGAVAEHHHVEGFLGFLRERLTRGVLFGSLRMEWERFGRARALALILGSILPLRLASNLAHCARHSLRGHRFGDFLITLPVVTAGFQASLLGEAWGCARSLARRARREVTGPREAG